MTQVQKLSTVKEDVRAQNKPLWDGETWEGRNRLPPGPWRGKEVREVGEEEQRWGWH